MHVLEAFRGTTRLIRALDSPAHLRGKARVRPSHAKVQCRCRLLGLNESLLAKGGGNTIVISDDNMATELDQIARQK